MGGKQSVSYSGDDHTILKCDWCYAVIGGKDMFASCEDCRETDFCMQCFNRNEHLQLNGIEGHVATHTVTQITSQQHWQKHLTIRRLKGNARRTPAPAPSGNGEDHKIMSYRCVSGDSGTFAVLEKPVIYVYAGNTEVDIEVRVQSREPSKHKLLYTYPPPSKRDDLSHTVQWNIRSNNMGVLTGNMPYLFYDAHTSLTFAEWKEFRSACAIVLRHQYETYLTHQLKCLGLVEGPEIAGFLTHWMPRMLRFPQCRIQFQSDIIETRFDLLVSPKPDVLIRVYMVFAGDLVVDQHLNMHGNGSAGNAKKLVNANERPLKPIAPRLPVENTNKLVVVEWGGTETFDGPHSM